MAGAAHLGNWNGPKIADECSVAYNAYRAAKTNSYRAYFTAHRELRDEHHEYKAGDLASALPEEWSRLADYLPEAERHQHHLSGNSSQVLALGVLGVGARLDPSLLWLWDALGPLPPPRTPAPSCQFEALLAPQILSEQPRQTSVDFLVRDPAALICIETKWAEAGIGSCSCDGDAPLLSRCSSRVLDRAAYWKVAAELFHVPAREEGRPCPLSFTYQAVRNVAAALALADEGQAPVFGVIYDAENPYFSGCGSWPGWPTALDATLNDLGNRIRFASISWQELIPLVPLDRPAAEWASEKHGLHKPAS